MGTLGGDGALAASARTNFGKEYGDLPVGLWNAALQDLMLIDGSWQRPQREIKRGDAEERLFARRLLDGLLWGDLWGRRLIGRHAYTSRTFRDERLVMRSSISRDA